MSNRCRQQAQRARRVEGTTFVPPHCPNRLCPHYLNPQEFAWQPFGSFHRISDDRRFQCFRCRHCRRRFSVRTFAGDYWLRKRDAYPRILAFASEGPGLRQAGRLLQLHHSTLMRHLARGGRQALLYHYGRLRNHQVTEPVAVDGFESFEYSQYFPFHLNLAAGLRSWFVYGFTESPLRRKGRMTAVQKRRREELERALGRPDPKAVPRGMSELLELVFRGLRPRRSASDALEIHSDDHPSYPPALRRFMHRSGHKLEQYVTPGTAPRTLDNPLFPVNLADLLLRHGQANHRRETIAFSKRRQGAIERAALFLLWRNDVKPRREKRPGETAAMAAGLATGPLRWEEFVRRRLFPRKRDLPGPTWPFYWAKIKTAVYGAGQRVHRLRYAF
jgi:hypothetical protein